MLTWIRELISAQPVNLLSILLVTSTVAAKFMAETEIASLQHGLTLPATWFSVGLIVTLACYAKLIWGLSKGPMAVPVSLVYVATLAFLGTLSLGLALLVTSSSSTSAMEPSKPSARLLLPEVPASCGPASGSVDGPILVRLITKPDRGLTL
jgi:hypothetical protein